MVLTMSVKKSAPLIIGTVIFRNCCHTAPSTRAAS